MKMFVFRSVIYKHSWWDRLRGKTHYEGGFSRVSPWGIIYTANVGKYYSCYGIDLVNSDERITALYYCVDNQLVSAGNNVQLPAWMSMRWVEG